MKRLLKMSTIWLPKKKNRKEILIFGEKGLEKSFKKLEWHLENDEIVSERGQIRCGICGQPLSRKNLAAFIPGSVKAVCTKPSCFFLASTDVRKGENTQ